MEDFSNDIPQILFLLFTVGMFLCFRGQARTIAALLAVNCFFVGLIIFIEHKKHLERSAFVADCEKLGGIYVISNNACVSIIKQF
jgi:hypothetical protein